MTTATSINERGFGEYGVVTDSRGNTVTVRQSSAVGGPYVYLFTADEKGNDTYRPGGRAVSPHLTVAQARELIACLERFVADEEAASERAP